jgi:hypothetical protein
MKLNETDLNKVGKLLEALRQELGASESLVIEVEPGRVSIMTYDESYESTAVGKDSGYHDTLGAAYINLLHQRAGTTPPPF